MFFKKHTTIQAPEFPQEAVWINDSPQSILSSAAKATLVHFWNMSCYFSIYALVQAQRWQDSYGAFGLRVIGIHSPEFPFEQDQNNVEKFLQKEKISVPTILDNDHLLWKKYHNSCSPCIYLIDARGRIIYSHTGSNGYPETEFAIHSALQDAGAKELPSLGPDESLGGKRFYPRTKDVYGGYLRANMSSVIPNKEQAFTDAGGTHLEGQLVLHGHWSFHAEAVEHTRHLASATEYFSVNYRAQKAFAVLSAAHPCQCLITLNNQPVPEDIRGADVNVLPTGQTYITITRPGLYELVNSPAFLQATLRISCADPGIFLYAISFA